MEDQKYSLKIIRENSKEKFSQSTCDCEKCREIHRSQKEWETFKPKTNLQKRMMDVIKRIESKYC